MVLTRLLAMLLNGLTVTVTPLVTTLLEHLATRVLESLELLSETDTAVLIQMAMNTLIQTLQELMALFGLLLTVQMPLPQSLLNGLTKTVMAMAIIHLVSIQIPAHRFMAHQPS
jgi:hypothetical protein